MVARGVTNPNRADGRIHLDSRSEGGGKQCATVGWASPFSAEAS